MSNTYISWSARGSGGSSGANTALSNLTTTAINEDLLFSGSTAREIRFAAAANTAGAGLTIAAQSASTLSNVTGGALVLKAGASTGNRESDGIYFSMGSPSASGTTTQSFYNILTLSNVASSKQSLMTFKAADLSSWITLSANDVYSYILLANSSAAAITLNTENVELSYTLKFPARQGTNKSFMYNNGSGTLEWSTVGQATLVAGTVTVSSTKVLSTSQFFLTCKIVGGTQGMLSVGTIVDNTSFVINSSNAADTSTISYMFI